MKVISNSRVKFDEKEQQLFANLIKFIENFDKDFCEKHCGDCPYTQNCDNIFEYEDTPYSAIRRAISFFEMIDPRED